MNMRAGSEDWARIFFGFLELENLKCKIEKDYAEKGTCR